jgi:hypothetical protein
MGVSMRKKEKKKSNREGFEAFLSKTAIGREYLEEIEDTISDLRANTRQLDSSKEQRAAKEDKKTAKNSTTCNTGTTS